jgi:thiosulfate/3-mercaptopyruvate sulfurtransferase
MKGYANPKLLVTAPELAALLQSAAPPVVLDVRPAEQFAAGRIPGAVHIDLFGVSLNDTDPGPLRAFLWTIAHALALRGLDPRRTAVLCDEHSGIRAARAFWFLEYFGHPDPRVLDGGFAAWTRAGLPVETGPAARPSKSDWPERDAERRDEIVATWRDVLGALDRPGTVILDTRSDAEYYGEVARSRRAGAVPGAVHVEWTRNLDADGAFRPAAELKRMYEDAGVTPDKEVIAYCQGGYRAAHAYLALRLLGYPRVRNYLGSWQEWGDREDLPLEIPSRAAAPETGRRQP